MLCERLKITPSEAAPRLRFSCEQLSDCFEKVNEIGAHARLAACAELLCQARRIWGLHSGGVMLSPRQNIELLSGIWFRHARESWSPSHPPCASPLGAAARGAALMERAPCNVPVLENFKFLLLPSWIPLISIAGSRVRHNNAQTTQSLLRANTSSKGWQMCCGAGSPQRFVTHGSSSARAAHAPAAHVGSREQRGTTLVTISLLIMYKALPHQLRRPVRDKGIPGLCLEAEQSVEGFISLLNAN